MLNNRRQFMQLLSLLPLPLGGAPAGGIQAGGSPVIKPGRLKPGDTVALVNPAGATFHSVDVEVARETLDALGLKVKLGDYVLGRRGYFAGTDDERARDLNAQFADSAVKGIFTVRGGWGSSRLLPLIDFGLIRENPKVLMGYSDISVLLLAIHAQTGLVTFHGPVGISSWNSYTVQFVRQILFDAQAATMKNPREIGDNLTQVEDRVQVITPGTARGKLLGGNLTVISAIIGSRYVPDWRGAILFLEDTDEGIYRIDRMLTQLKLAGVLNQISGFVFGKCTKCGPGEGYGSLTLEEVLNDHIRPLAIPAWFGAMIGHIPKVFTLPVGVQAEIDATAGAIRLLEPAVV
ncbi:MAG: LD-carboxypeptidase [Acidobacteria bacterium]|nr:MAG: LD-carboxypeptidase [Acidobacteriota bacterium]